MIEPLLKKTKVYIPTKGRTERQITMTRLPNDVSDHIVFVICPEEETFFRRHWPKHELLIVDKQGVPAARQAVMDIFDDEFPYVIFLDDDLRYVCREEDWCWEIPQMRQCNEVDVRLAFQWMEERLDKYAMVGLGARGMNNGIPDRYEREASRIMRTFGVDRNLIREEGIRFDEFMFWEDFHVTLSLLTRGYPNVMSTVYCTDGTTNDVGGVSLYRNRAALEVERARFLEMWGQWCKPSEKRAKNWGNIDEDTMPDLIVAWRKAYAYGLEQLRNEQSYS